MMRRVSALATDLYELTMAAAYFENGRRDEATFELFVRALPAGRAYLVVAGLEQALEFLTEARFGADDVEFLRRQPVFKHVSREFFDFLRDWRFMGEVWAMPEGTVAFANEPLLRVTAPIIDAQIVETFLLATINFQTLIASKAARVVAAAQGRSVIEFGTRRAHGFEAGVLAARAAYVGGCAGTSNVEAGRRFGIPIFGTLAHSFVMAFDREEDAFGAFLKVFPETATILVDTYDTVAAVKLLAQKFRGRVPAVRLDSGDLKCLSAEVRKCLNEAGMRKTKIFASGDLNEYRIAELLAAGAPIDGFGVGTELSTSADAPALGGVYKLVSAAAGGRVKLSAEKLTYPHAKQVWRHAGGDVIGLADEKQAGEPLLELVMKKGKPISVCRLAASRTRAAEQLARLPAGLRALDAKPGYPVRYSDRLEQARREVADDIRKGRAGAG